MLSTFMMGVVYMAIIFVIVRPGSDFSKVITDTTNAMANLITAAVKGEIS